MIHPFSNGKAYKWGKLRSLFDFFFPLAKNGKYEYIRREAVTHAKQSNGKTTVVSRDFYTFRAFFWHYFYALFVNPFKNLRQDAELFAKNLGIDAKYAFSIGAIAYDTSAGITPGVNASPFTWSHTCTGANLLLAVGTDIESGSTLTGVTYNAVTMTQYDTVNRGAGYANYLHGLIAPATGSNTVSVSYSGGNTTTYGFSASYSGCAQSGQPDSHNTTSSGSAVTSFSASTTVVAVNCWLIAMVSWEGSSGAAGAGTTVRQNPNGARGFADSNATVGTGSQSLNFTQGSGGYSVVIASIAPVAVNTSNVRGGFLQWL